MELPVELKMKIEELCQGVSVNTLKQCVENMSQRYKNQSGQGKKLVNEDIETLAYAITRMPATYNAIMSSLKEIPGGIDHVLDVGAGMATASWAIYETFNIQSITCVERIDAMISLGKKLMKDSELEKHVTWLKQDMMSLDLNQKYDLVIASYSLNELSDEDRTKMVDKLWSYTNKYLVIVEPGTPKAFLHMKQIKDQLVLQDASIIGPCPTLDHCPLPENDWCHFTCRLSRSKLHMALKGGTVPYEDEKFSYFVFSKEKIQNTKSRILRHPQIESKKITLELCSQEGLQTKTYTKKDKELFKKARKASSGDVF